jgi:pimeloyl-ACP methyl ester carboxylesterase
MKPLSTLMAVALLAICCGADEAPKSPAPQSPPADPQAAWKRIEPFFTPPAEFKGVLGPYRNPLQFNDGSIAKTPDDWKRRRQEILDDWHNAMGPWPEMYKDPKLEITKTEQRENFTQHKVMIHFTPDHGLAGYLLVPPGAGPFPAVLVVFYDAESSIGTGKSANCDYGLQLTRRGFVTLNIGSPTFNPINPKKPDAAWQPLSHLAYVAANCHALLSARKEVDPQRIGVVGHSYGGKWALFASCLYDKFAAAVWSDPGIVFDESLPNVNYWENWYLGAEAGAKRKVGTPSKDNPRTGAYKNLIDNKHDLTELHALMAPRPFLVSGGSEDPPYRWKALNHAAAVYKLLDHDKKIGLTARPDHNLTPEALNQTCDFFEHFLKNTPAAKSP